MTLKEFSAWLEGYIKGIGDDKSLLHWEIIKAKLDSINPTGYYSDCVRKYKFPQLDQESQFIPPPIMC